MASFIDADVVAVSWQQSGLQAPVSSYAHPFQPEASSPSPSTSMSLSKQREPEPESEPGLTLRRRRGLRGPPHLHLHSLKAVGGYHLPRASRPGFLSEDPRRVKPHDSGNHQVSNSKPPSATIGSNSVDSLALATSTGHLHPSHPRSSVNFSTYSSKGPTLSEKPSEDRQSKEASRSGPWDSASTSALSWSGPFSPHNGLDITSTKKEQPDPQLDKAPADSSWLNLSAPRSSCDSTYEASLSSFTSHVSTSDSAINRPELSCDFILSPDFQFGTLESCLKPLPFPVPISAPINTVFDSNSDQEDSDNPPFPLSRKALSMYEVQKGRVLFLRPDGNTSSNPKRKEGELARRRKSLGIGLAGLGAKLRGRDSDFPQSATYPHPPKSPQQFKAVDVELILSQHTPNKRIPNPNPQAITQPASAPAPARQQQKDGSTAGGIVGLDPFSSDQAKAGSWILPIEFQKVAQTPATSSQALSPRSRQLFSFDDSFPDSPPPSSNPWPGIRKRASKKTLSTWSPSPGVELPATPPRSAESEDGGKMNRAWRENPRKEEQKSWKPPTDWDVLGPDVPSPVTPRQRRSEVTARASPTSATSRGTTGSPNAVEPGRVFLHLFSLIGRVEDLSISEESYKIPSPGIELDRLELTARSTVTISQFHRSCQHQASSPDLLVPDEPRGSDEMSSWMLTVTGKLVDSPLLSRRRNRKSGLRPTLHLAESEESLTQQKPQNLVEWHFEAYSLANLLAWHSQIKVRA